ncbi:MAG: zinc ribbon domain-containing protein [Candidatus Hydrothermarchaeales archaeon]
MDCSNCGERVKESWKFCPRCGNRQKERLWEGLFPSSFERLFQEIEKEFVRIDGLFSEEFPMNIFKEQSIGGIDIDVYAGIDKGPRIDLRTHKDYRKHEPEIKRNLGIKESGAEKRREPPRFVREPRAELQKLKGRIILKIEIPLTKSEKDIEIQKLSESIEVKAYAGDTAYFRLFRVPPNSRIISKRLEDGVLIIEIQE